MLDLRRVFFYLLAGFYEPGEDGRAPEELIGLASRPALTPLMFRLELLAFCMIGFELDGLCFCCEPDEIRFLEPVVADATVLLG